METNILIGFHSTCKLSGRTGIDCTEITTLSRQTIYWITKIRGGKQNTGIANDAKPIVQRNHPIGT